MRTEPSTRESANSFLQEFSEGLDEAFNNEYNNREQVHIVLCVIMVIMDKFALCNTAAIIYCIQYVLWYDQ